MKGLAEVLARGIHDADDSIDMRYATHIAESAQPAVLDWLRERLAGAREDVWDSVAGVRDASPRLPNDADTDEVIDAALAVVAEALGVTAPPTVVTDASEATSEALGIKEEQA